MRNPVSFPIFLGLFLLLLAGPGCYYREPVRHLASDISLITPNLTRQEVLNALGHPDHKQESEGGEIWTYYEVKQSTLRKTPLLGTKLGAEQYDVATITFAGDRVRTCVYRSFDESDLEKNGIKINGSRAQ